MNLSFTFKWSIFFASSCAVQLDKLELVKICQSAVYQGGTCYQKAARLETQESGWSLWSNQNMVCLRALGREKQMTWKVRRQKKMSVSEKWLTARPVYAKDRGFSQAFLCSPGCQLKHAEEQEQSGVGAWSKTSWAEQKDSGSWDWAPIKGVLCFCPFQGWSCYSCSS